MSLMVVNAADIFVNLLRDLDCCFILLLCLDTCLCIYPHICLFLLLLLLTIIIAVIDGF